MVHKPASKKRSGSEGAIPEPTEKNKQPGDPAPNSDAGSPDLMLSAARSLISMIMICAESVSMLLRHDHVDTEKLNDLAYRGSGMCDDFTHMEVHSVAPYTDDPTKPLVERWSMRLATTVTRIGTLLGGLSNNDPKAASIIQRVPGSSRLREEWATDLSSLALEAERFLDEIDAIISHQELAHVAAQYPKVPIDPFAKSSRRPPCSPEPAKTDPGAGSPFGKPDGWTRKELVSQANHDGQVCSNSTFDKIRIAASIPSGSKGGKGAQRRYSVADLHKLIDSARRGRFQKGKEIAVAWAQLLPE